MRDLGWRQALETARNRRSVTIALIALIAIRLLCAAGWLYMSVASASTFAFLMALWNVAPAWLALRRIRLALRLVVGWNLFVVLLGLATLPNFGRLHGGEALAYAAVPALLELGLGLFVLRSLRSLRSS